MKIEDSKIEDSMKIEEMQDRWRKLYDFQLARIAELNAKAYYLLVALSFLWSYLHNCHQYSTMFAVVATLLAILPVREFIEINQSWVMWGNAKVETVDARLAWAKRIRWAKVVLLFFAIALTVYGLAF